MMIRGNRKNWFLVLLLVFAMIAVGEIGKIWTASAAPSAKPIKLRMMMPGEPSGPGPEGGFHGALGVSEPIVYNVLEPLVDVGKKGEFVPKLATKWEHSTDLTKWRFYLRKGVKFHNGADFTARDVVEFVKWIIAEKTASKVYVRVPVKEAVAVNDYTVDLIFEKPQPLLLISGRVFLIPPIALTRDNREMYKTNPIGTGPYRFAEWSRGQHIKLTKFEGYWGPKPQIDDVEIFFREEAAVRLAALQAGEVDWVYALSPEQANHAPKIVRIASPETVWLRFDEVVQNNPIFADKRLRLAVEYAIDRKALISLYGGLVTPSLGQFASPGEFGFNPSLKSRSYDLAKAKSLVKEAGAVGKVVSFVAPSDRFSKGREVAEAIAYMIEQTGLKVKLMLMPRADVDRFKTTVGNTQYMCDILLFPTDALLEVESRYGVMFVGGVRQSAINDPEADKLYKEALAEIDYTKRGQKLAKAWGYLYEQAHYAPLFKLEWMWGVAKNLEWKADITGRPFFADMKFTDRLE